MTTNLPEWVSGVVTVRHADARIEKMDLGPGEWRPMNLHPNGYQIDHFELGESGDDGEREVIVVLTRLRF